MSHPLQAMISAKCREIDLSFNETVSSDVSGNVSTDGRLTLVFLDRSDKSPCEIEGFGEVEAVNIPWSEDIFFRRGSSIYSRVKFDDLDPENVEGLINLFNNSIAPKIDEVKDENTRLVELAIKEYAITKFGQIDDVNSLLDKIARENNAIAALQRQIDSHFDAIAAVREEIDEAIKRNNPENFARLEWEKLQTLIGGKIQEIRHVSKTELHFITMPVTIVYNNVTYAFGQFNITVNLHQNNLECYIKTYADNIYSGGHYHPHISSEQPCMGNIGRDYNRSLNSGDIYGAVHCISELLFSYNSGNPYRQIQTWNAEVANTNEYEECYDGADPTLDCITCTRNGCPFHATRYDRCWAEIERTRSFDSCVRCGRCDFQHRAQAKIEEMNNG